MSFGTFGGALGLAVLAAVGMAAPSTLSAKEKDQKTGTQKNSATYVVTSTEFANGSDLPKTASCDGKAKSPELDWKTPKGSKAKSYALVVEDPDAPKGTFTHWVLFDIPPGTTSLPHGVSNVGVSGTNSADKTGYTGACPPPGHGVHRYFFRLYALDVDKLGQKEGASRADVDAAMKTHVVGQGELMGTYERR